MRYFDHNATSPLCAAAREAWLAATAEYIGNPSSPHRIGSRAEVALEAARARLAERLGCDAHEIIWTSGATESLNTAIHHYATTEEGEAWIFSLEHPAVHESARHSFGNRVRAIPALPSGVLDLDWLQRALEDRPPSVIITMAANNETGALQPWKEVLGLCTNRGVRMLCDAAQWIGKLPAMGLGGCHSVAGCAHKFGGPAGVGFLKMEGQMTPLLRGGMQEDGRRGGTENVAGVMAMVAALDAREAEMAAGGCDERLQWREQFLMRLQHGLPKIQVIAREVDALWNTASVVMPEGDCRRRWVVILDRLGFAVSTGSACASGKEKPSHVLSAMGYSPALSSRVLRFSSGWETRREEWDELLVTLAEACRESVPENLATSPDAAATEYAGDRGSEG